MDLLTTIGVIVPPRRRALRMGVGISALFHALMAALMLIVPARATISDVPIEIAVDVVTEVVTPPPVLPLAEPAVAPLATVRSSPEPRTREATPRAPRPAPDQPAERAPVAAAAPLTGETAPAEEAPTSAASTDSPPRPAQSLGTDGSTAGTTAWTGSTTMAGAWGRPAGGAPARGDGAGFSAGDRSLRARVDRYSTDALGRRIREVFRYPSEARDLELAGRVLLNVSIGQDGRLLGVRLSGRCPHAILCADGLRTIRAAAPFPPLPAELGPSIAVEVPLTYAFAGAVD